MYLIIINNLIDVISRLILYVRVYIHIYRIVCVRETSYLNLESKLLIYHKEKYTRK